MASETQKMELLFMNIRRHRSSIILEVIYRVFQLEVSFQIARYFAAVILRGFIF